MDDLFLVRKPEIILLDYQCTLCANGHLRQKWLFDPANRGKSYAEWINGEIMRNWLIPLFGDCKVILLTARKSQWEKVTMKRILESCDWIPDEWHFNDTNSQPPELKQRFLTQYVFPQHGTPTQTAYLALESNKATRAMYHRNGITAVRIDEPIAQLPRC